MHVSWKESNTRPNYENVLVFLTCSPTEILRTQSPWCSIFHLHICSRVLPYSFQGSTEISLIAVKIKDSSPRVYLLSLTMWFACGGHVMVMYVWRMIADCELNLTRPLLLSYFSESRLNFSFLLSFFFLSLLWFQKQSLYYRSFFKDKTANIILLLVLCVI